jgi:hypothetical protein
MSEPVANVPVMMKPRDLARYLLGDRRAILAAAGTRGLLGLGLLFVLSSGLAREYDAEDLVREPWYALLPIPASLLTSALLYWYVRRMARRCGVTAGPLNYAQFLGLYWLTAPLAWLCSLPVERFLSAQDSGWANLALLAVVATWRVLLFARVVSVVYGAPYWNALVTVLMLADGVYLLASNCTPLPLIGVMGGIRASESQQPLAIAAVFAAFAALIAWPFLMIAIKMAADQGPRWQPVAIDVHPRVARSLWGVASGAILLGLAALPFTQPEQMLRRTAERLAARGDWPRAVSLMSAHVPGDFPPYWQPPPEYWPGYRLLLADTERVNAVLDAGPAPWVRKHYLARYCRRLNQDLPLDAAFDREEISALLALLERWPEIAAACPVPLGRQLRELKSGTPQFVRLRALLAAGPPE